LVKSWTAIRTAITSPLRISKWVCQ
jgi:hypothetical protein